MTYDNINVEKPILRDYLAAERTHLANERTLLAYTRTAIFVLVSGLTFLKLFETDQVLRVVSLLLIPVALAIGAFGVYRFRLTRKKLAVYEKMQQ
jgi:putative membrane protein